MKIVIWVACVFVFSLVQAAIKSQGIVLGGVPTVLLALLLVFLPAPALCRWWSRRKQQPAIPKEEQEERWYTCKKCGQLVREGENCDCAAIQRAKEDKLCGTPFVQARQRLDEELAAGNITQKEYDERSAAFGVPTPETPTGPICEPTVEQPRKKSRLPVVLSVLCAVLAVCSCALGYYAANLSAEREKLAAENEILNATLHDLSDDNQRLQIEVDALDARNEDLFNYFYDAVFLYYNIGFIVSGSNRYHSYDCPVFQSADEYWAHNIEYCEYLGYSKCGNCW